MAVAKIVPGTTRLGWIGTGVMGLSMCSHLIAKGFAMHGLQPSRKQGPSALGPAARRGRIHPSKWPSKAT